VVVTDKYQKIIDIMRKQTAERLADPVKLREWIRQVHGPEMRELIGEEAEQMLVVLKLVGHHSDSNNQITHTYFYKYNDKEYRITYGAGDDPLIEEVLPYDL
jgi:hypothetical protein